MVPFDVRYGFLFLLSLRHTFFSYSTAKMSWPWNPGHRSLKVIGTDTDRSATYDCLLT